MDVRYAQPDDFEAWIALAREVEPLFGPMADEPGFREALRQAICQNTALCMHPPGHSPKGVLPGGIVISKAGNEIAWLAVAQQHRGMGYGRRLLAFALGELDPEQDIIVQTFAGSVEAGAAARRLYLGLGFVDHEDGGLNPAGVPTVIMRLARDRALGA